MPLSIPCHSPNLPQFTDILLRFKAHAEVCETCKINSRQQPCKTGATILQELHQIPDVEWTPNDP